MVLFVIAFHYYIICDNFYVNHPIDVEILIFETTPRFMGQRVSFILAHNSSYHLIIFSCISDALAKGLIEMCFWPQHGLQRKFRVLFSKNMYMSKRSLVLEPKSNDFLLNYILANSRYLRKL